MILIQCLNFGVVSAALDEVIFVAMNNNTRSEGREGKGAVKGGKHVHFPVLLLFYR